MTSFLMYAFRVSSNSTSISHQQETSKDLQQALDWNQPPRWLPDPLRDQDSQMDRGEHHHHDQQPGQDHHRESLYLADERFQCDLHVTGQVHPRCLARPVSYTHLRAHETDSYLVCRLLLEK